MGSLDTVDTVLGMWTGHDTGPTSLSPRQRLLRLKEAAAYLGVSSWTLRQMAHRHEIPFIQRTEGSPMLFDVHDLHSWIEEAKK